MVQQPVLTGSMYLGMPFGCATNRKKSANAKVDRQCVQVCWRCVAQAQQRLLQNPGEAATFCGSVSKVPAVMRQGGS